MMTENILTNASDIAKANFQNRASKAGLEKADVEALYELRHEFFAQLPERLERLRELLNQTLSGKPDAFRQAVDLAHRLRGTGTAFGQRWVTELGEAIEEALKHAQSTSDFTNPVVIGHLTELANEAIAQWHNSDPNGEELTVSERDAPFGHEPEGPLAVLLIEDDEFYGKLVQRILKTSSPRFILTWVTTLAMAGDVLARENFDIVITDLELPDAHELEALSAMRELNVQIPIVILTGRSEAGIAVQAVKNGAQDFIIKERVSADSLVRSIYYAVERAKATESRLRAEAIKDFMGMLAHDLRIPLLGASRVLEYIDRPDLAPEQRQEIIAEMRRSNEQLLHLVTKLIDVYRDEVEPECAAVQTVDLTQVIERAATKIAPRIEKHSLKLNIDVEGGLHAIQGDASSLERLFTNLLDNACKFSPDQGAVTVRLKNKSNNTVEINVSDKGPGIPPDACDMLFKRVWHGTAGKSYAAFGGLGLYHCDKIVRTHKGSITFNTSGVGTTFTVELPRRSDLGPDWA